MEVELRSDPVNLQCLPPGVSRRTPPETSRLAECVGNTRSLLRKILSECGRRFTGCREPVEAPGGSTGCDAFKKLADKILGECHRTFTMCFHAFYPTAHLKWLCLCELLNWIDPVSSSSVLVANAMF